MRACAPQFCRTARPPCSTLSSKRPDWMRCSTLCSRSRRSVSTNRIPKSISLPWTGSPFLPPPSRSSRRMPGMPMLHRRSGCGSCGAIATERSPNGCPALCAGVIAAPILCPRAARAAFPDRPVKIVVANSPGGPSDIVARLLAAALQQALGGSFIVENKGGAGGNIGMGSAARTEPDGYTLLITTSVYAVNPGLYNSLPYDPFKDFVAIAEIATTPNIFSVKPQLGVRTITELVALAKASPDKFFANALGRGN